MTQPSKRPMRMLAGMLLAASMFAAHAAPAWQEGNTYTAGTVVTYSGRDYQALTTHTAYVGANWNPASTPTLWQDLGGSSVTPTYVTQTPITPPPTPCPTCNDVLPSTTPTPVVTPVGGCKAAWVSGSVYTGGNQISYNGVNYEAKWWTQGDNPAQSGDWGVWKSLGGCTGVTPITPTGVTPLPALQADESVTLTSYPQGCWVPNPQPAPLPRWQINVSYAAGQSVQPASGALNALWQGVSRGAYLRAAQAHVSSAANEPKQVSGSWQIDRAYWKVVAVVPTTVPCPPTPTPTVVTPTVTPTITPTPTVTPTTTPTPTQVPGDLPKHALVGYWHNFTNPSGNTFPISQVSDDWDVIVLSFGENAGGGTVAFHLDPNAGSEAQFIADIAAKRAKGKKVILSLGGQDGSVTLNSASDVTNFVNSLYGIITKYGLDGIDLDLESGSGVSLGAPIINNLVTAVKQLKAKVGPGFYLSMAPEHPYVQGGYVSYGSIWGAYLPIIDGLRDDLSVIHVQYYNNGGFAYTDGRTLNEGTVDALVGGSLMLIEGFKVNYGTGWEFKGLRADQVAFGVPSGSQSAGRGFVTAATVKNALTCLTQLVACDTVKPKQAYPDYRGVMTWSINWDKHDGYNFSKPARAALNALP
ncbi:carbohydrate-binding protein [Chitinolyticbacter albus]|uniref:carbohydrate-binding protein n=1 Tax=Chitinolyticbacter albus TaxID=2961951 RepID=UPI00210C868A|nr:glycosyl hydrolase family 18 protein [Chitinolyticbacter albus]